MQNNPKNSNANLTTVVLLQAIVSSDNQQLKQIVQETKKETKRLKQAQRNNQVNNQATTQKWMAQPASASHTKKSSSNQAVRQGRK